MTTDNPCPTGKVKHANAKDARRQIRRLSRNPANRRTRGVGHDPTKVEPYRCWQCDSWHVGRPPRRR